jgi:hypothetical protein
VLVAINKNVAIENVVLPNSARRSCRKRSSSRESTGTLPSRTPERTARGARGPTPLGRWGSESTGAAGWDTADPDTLRPDRRLEQTARSGNYSGSAIETVLAFTKARIP